MKNKLKVILPIAVIFVAIVTNVILMFVYNKSEVNVSEDVVIKPEEIIPDNPELLTVEDRTSAFGVYESPTHDTEISVEPVEPDSNYDKLDFGNGVYTFNFTIQKAPSYEEVEKVAEWCKAQGIQGYILYYESELDIKENYDPQINLDRCYTCSVDNGDVAYDYIIYIDANGDPQQYYYEPQE